MIHPIADLPLLSRHRVSQITFHPTQPYLAVQSHERSVEIFRIRTEEEVRKKQARRKKRAKEKKDKGKGGAENGDGDNETNDLQVNLVDLFTPYLVIRASGKIRSFDFSSDEVSSKSGIQVMYPRISKGRTS
jgi:U3 small nucleolar RNA-associated protein 12